MQIKKCYFFGKTLSSVCARLKPLAAFCSIKQSSRRLMNRSLYALILSSVFIFGSCQDEEINAKKGIKLDYYIESYDLGEPGFEPQLKVTYEYGESGRIHQYTVISYNPGTGVMTEQRHFVFSYSNGKVEHINGYLPGNNSPYIEYAYHYLPNGEVSRITEKNHETGINSEASFSYEENGTIKVSYVFSNGGSFQYEFDYAGDNVSHDKTTRGSQLCSDGQYTYDQHVNPFKDLGYVDYMLTNLSANNKLTENINYVGCAFPSLVPESYTYEYNDKGYPILATTFYKSTGSVTKSTREFFYKSE